MPGNRLARIRALVTDDLGRAWSLNSGQTAGTGTEWHSSWRYRRPGPGGTRLSVEFRRDDVPVARCELALA